MKIVFCFFAMMVAYVACETCTSVSECTGTSCTGDFTLGCAQGMCVCNHNTNQVSCTTRSDCANAHVCHQHQGATDYHCIDQTCRCAHPHGGGHGGPGGN